MNSTSPGFSTHLVLFASENFGKRFKSGLAISTGDITMEVLSRSFFRENFLVVKLMLSIASGMCAS